MLANAVDKQQDSNHSNASEDVAQMMAQMVCLKVEAPTQRPYYVKSCSDDIFRRPCTGLHFQICKHIVVRIS